MTVFEFKEKFPHCDLMTQMIYPRLKGFESKVCFHNYYERVLKRPVQTDLYLFSHDDKGKMTESQKIEVPSDESVQVCINQKMEGFGIVCVGAVPRLSLDELNSAPYVIKTPQTAGFYMLWEHHDSGRVDSSHEWESLQFGHRVLSQYYVCLPASPWIRKRSLFIYNPQARHPVTIKVSINEKPFLIKRLEPLSGWEAELDNNENRDAFAVIEGAISAPMTIEEGSTGDVHIHHS